MAVTGHKAQTLLRKPQYQDFVLDALPISANNTLAAPIYEGDLSYMENDGVAPINAGGIGTDADFLRKISLFLGGAAFSSPTNYWNHPAAISGKVLTRGVFDLYTTVGDTYNVFDTVTVGADAQTITKVDTVCPKPTLAVGGVDGVFEVGLHTVQLGYRMANGYVALSNPVTIVTAATNHIAVTAGALPAWATAMEVFVDGIYAVDATASGTVNVTGENTTGKATASGPLVSNIAIGIILPRQDQVFPVVGVQYLPIRVSIRSKYPFNGLI